MHLQAVKAREPLNAVGSSRRVERAKVADLVQNPATGHLISACGPDGPSESTDVVVPNWTVIKPLVFGFFFVAA